MSSSLTSALLCAAALLAGCQSAHVSTTPTTAAASSFDALLAEFTQTNYELNPTLAVSAGLHAFDGKLPDYRPEALSAQTRWLQQMRERTASLDDAPLSQKQRLYREYLAVEIDTQLFNIESLKVFENNAWTAYLPLDPDPYVSRQYAPLAVRMDAYTKHVEALPAAVAAMRRSVRPMPPGHAVILEGYLSGLADYVASTPAKIFAAVQDSTRQAAMQRANERAGDALRATAEWIKSLPHTDSFVLGPQKFAELLWAFERVGTPVGELKEIAERDVARNQQALRRACEKFMPGASVIDCRSRVASRKPADGPVAAAGRQVSLLKQRILERNIVTLPTEEAVIVAESPPQWSQGSGTAYVSIPGPTEKGVPSIYYITPPNAAWSAEDRQQYLQSEADLMATTVHCVWPGHVLETLRSRQSGNPLTVFTYSYAYTEGWTHYVEEMMVHEALDDDPEMMIGALQNALNSNLRILAAIGVHTGGMSIAAAERMFREQAFADPENARQEAVRASFDPGYMFYSLGKLMIIKLRDDWLRQHPDATLRDFHDAFLSYGTTPVRLVRKAMLGEHDDARLFH